MVRDGRMKFVSYLLLPRDTVLASYDLPEFIPPRQVLDVVTREPSLMSSLRLLLLPLLRSVAFWRPGMYRRDFVLESGIDKAMAC
jgi:hypothetical protein